MARPETIIVGGGIAATSPFTVGAIPYIVSTSPPSLSATTVAAFTTGTGGTHPALVISTTLTDPQAAADEPLRVKGGAIIEGVGTDSVVIGRLASSPGSLSVVIGKSAVGAGSAAVAVGPSADASGSSCTAIGSTARADGSQGTAIGADSDATGANALAVGMGAQATGTNSTALGATAAASASGAVAIGFGTIANVAGAVVIGGGAATANGFKVVILAGGSVTARADKQIWILAGGTTPTTTGATGGTIVIGGNDAAYSITHADNICIGMGLSSFAANVCQVGGPGTPIATVVLGEGDSKATAFGGMTIRTTNTAGSNLAAGNLTIQTPLGTGNASVGAMLFQVGTVQASGSTQHVSVTGLGILESVTANDMFISIRDVSSGSLKRVSRGAADSGGAGFRVLRIAN